MITSETIKDFYLINHRKHIGKFLKKYNLNTVICEIGVAAGDNFFNLLKTAQPISIYGVDIWNDYSIVSISDFTTKQSIREQDYSDFKEKVKEYPDMKIIKDYSINAVNQFPDGFFDYIYIDADHHYEGIKQDIDSWWPKVKTNGILAGHDYKSLNNCGVKRAVDEFVIENEIKYFSTTFEICCSWLIFKTNLDIKE